MPLIVVCGIPGSGKTKRSKEVAAYLSEKYSKNVFIINEETLGIDKNTSYASSHINSHQQKIARGRIKFQVEKNLIGNNIVIADSLNYIKGYRYQMYCIAREQKTTYCVIYCNTPLEKALSFNKMNENKFSDELVEQLFKRMEAPQLKNRWDIPLFQRRDEQETPLQEIAQTLLFETKKSKDPVSTKQDQKLSQDYLYQVDEICSNICKEACLGNLKLKHNWSALEAKKLKNEFTAVIREKPMPLKVIKDTFIQFLTEADKRK